MMTKEEIEAALEEYEHQQQATSDIEAVKSSVI